MAIRPNGLVFQHIRTLYDVGVAGDLTDAELLERFTTLDREAAETAFTALVERHGPMVLRVCRNLLKNRQDAEDACQATFLILMRKARFVWVRNSLAPWLHRVARRVASRARSSTLRRREHERRAAELRLKVVHADDHAEELIGLLHAEIDRLPEKYRAAVIVCDMEGLSQERAARQLGLPLGTVKSRLARARQILRRRLTTRGLAAPAILVLMEVASSSVDAAVSFYTVNSTLRAALLAAKSPTIGVVSIGVANLAEEVLEMMFLTKWKLTWAGLLIACALSAGTAAVLARQNDGSKPNSAANRPDARRAEIKGPAGELGATTAPDFIKQSRGMIIGRLEHELALARARLDRTLRRVASPDDPAALQARRTADEIEGLLARIDGVLIEAVDRFPTMFDFSGGQDDLILAPGSPRSGTMMKPNVNDVYQSSADKSGNWQKHNPNGGAQSQSAEPSGGTKNDRAGGQDNSPSSNSKSGQAQENNPQRQAGNKNTEPSGGKEGSGTQWKGDSPSSGSKAGDAQPNDQSGQHRNPTHANTRQQSKGNEQGSIQSQQQKPETSQQPQRSQRQGQGPEQSQQQDPRRSQQPNANQNRQQNAYAMLDRGDKAIKRRATDGADVDVTVTEGKRMIEVGGKTTFQIRLQNYGTKDANHLRVRAKLSRNLEFIKADTPTHDVGVRVTSQENAVTFEPIDKLGPGKEIILGVLVKVAGSAPKLATCRVSVAHDELPEGTEIEDIASVKAMISGVFGNLLR